MSILVNNKLSGNNYEVNAQFPNTILIFGHTVCLCVQVSCQFPHNSTSWPQPRLPPFRDLRLNFWPKVKMKYHVFQPFSNGSELSAGVGDPKGILNVETQRAGRRGGTGGGDSWSFPNFRKIKAQSFSTVCHPNKIHMQSSVNIWGNPMIVMFWGSQL